MVHKNSVSPVMDDMDMDPHLQTFLRDKANTLIKWDMIRFFNDNPHSVDTAENIANYTGRDVPTVSRALAGLAETDVLEVREISGVKLYSLRQDTDNLEVVRRFVQACDDRQFRVKAINHVIRTMD